MTPRVMYLNADPGVPVLGLKGASIHVRELTRALTRAGAHVVVAAPRIEPEGADPPADVDLVAIPGVLPRKLTLAALEAAVDDQAAAVQTAARAGGVDAIYERFSLFSAAGVRAARALGIPHVLEVNAPLRDEATRFRTLPHPEQAQSLEREILAATDHVMVVSPPLAAHVVAHGADPARVAVVPNGVDGDAPVSAGPGAGPLVVGFAGSLKPWHGVEVLLQACALAAQNVPGLVLEVIGHGPLTDAVTAAAVAPAELRHLGALDHAATRARIATWDVGAAPYLALDDFWFSPLKVLEYMAAAVCPVASALGELPELLGHGERGVLVAPGDAVNLTQAIVALAQDPAGTHARGRLARAHVLQHRSWAAIAHQVLTTIAAGRRLTA
ncbi:glycosyltransferase family 4 protein [Paraconexibacter antarcticus]|uniref:Glycosyltransferase family 4 protein n=1 Tax=Paraconexibacter antarcticus TaxID=2949664 RepID=A0ABY5DMK0_9ACTN|nr:glycosyltransferase family 4 protein [Paraconexibacter antarcticus]UTI62272.1 glycosyltransferase family 4 protein [Paraconexibacter antarcticus]